MSSAELGRGGKIDVVASMGDDDVMVMREGVDDDDGGPIGGGSQVPNCAAGLSTAVAAM